MCSCLNWQSFSISTQKILVATNSGMYYLEADKHVHSNHLMRNTALSESKPYLLHTRDSFHGSLGTKNALATASLAMAA